MSWLLRVHMVDFTIKSIWLKFKFNKAARNSKSTKKNDQLELRLYTNHCTTLALWIHFTTSGDSSCCHLLVQIVASLQLQLSADTRACLWVIGLNIRPQLFTASVFSTQWLAAQTWSTWITNWNHFLSFRHSPYSQTNNFSFLATREHWQVHSVPEELPLTQQLG